MSIEEIGNVTVPFLKYNNLSVKRLVFLTSPITSTHRHLTEQ